MEKLRVSILSYTNSKPFLYGLEQTGIIDEIELQQGLSFECAQRLIKDEVDLALVPVAALYYYPDFRIVGDFCIGATMPVNSVFIFSTKPISDITTIKFDPQSRTSNHLAKVLFKHHWNIAPEESLEDPDAHVLIGDATFGKSKDYKYVYDLAEEWMKFSGYPFTFAVWAANKPIDDQFLKKFNAALGLGVNKREEVIANLPPRLDYDLADYLRNRISYPFDLKKKDALNKFLALIDSIATNKN